MVRAVGGSYVIPMDRPTGRSIEGGRRPGRRGWPLGLGEQLDEEGFRPTPMSIFTRMGTGIGP